MAGVSRPCKIRLLRIAFLAPGTVEAIQKGEQPVELTAKGLLTLDLASRDQRWRPGFAAGEP